MRAIPPTATDLWDAAPVVVVVRVGQEGAGHLGATPLPVSAVKLSFAEVLASPGGVILTRERDLEDDLIWTEITIRDPEIRTL